MYTYPNKHLRKDKAKKAKECRLCEKPWEISDNIYILSDKENDRYELICEDCGIAIENARKGINKESSDDDIVSVLKEIAKTLKELVVEVKRWRIDL